VSDAVEAAAEAICNQDAMFADWKTLVENWGPDCCKCNDYRRMAQAAIDALGLTEEWAIRCGANIARAGMSEENARYKEAHWPDSFQAVSRLVSPWVRADE
jgi:hypothetical protein